VLGNFFDAEAIEEKLPKSEKKEIVQRFVFFDFKTRQQKFVKQTALCEHFEHQFQQLGFYSKLVSGN